MNRLRSQDWMALVLELVIVVIGIFLAIQANGWLADRQDARLEREYIVRLLDDVERDSVSISQSIELADLRRGFADLLMEVAERPDAALARPVEFLVAVPQAFYTNTPATNSDTMEELRATGSLGLLRNPTLKAALFDYYRYDESERQYISLHLMMEARHFELAAGVLSNRQVAWIQDRVGIPGPAQMDSLSGLDVDLEAVASAARRLAGKPDFVAWLPQARGIQVELIEAHGFRLEKARQLALILRELVSGFGS